jgi:hypothetical protein
MSAPRKAKNAVVAGSESPSPDDLEALLNRIRLYLIKCSNPLETWRTIESFVEDGLGLAEIGSQDSVPGVQNTQQFKDELMTDSKTVKTIDTLSHGSPSLELKQLLIEVIDNPETWLSTPSVQFGGRKPGDLVGTEEEFKLFDLLHAVDQGLF